MNLFKSLLKNEPLIISGPCSAENEEQVLKTATELSKTNTNVYRAGIWKPRTRPGTFEGVGEIGLSWLQKAKRKTGLPIAVEVANASHVEQALKHEVDIIWLGARTTVNPFSVQEIADALKGTTIPVMVKNPLNPDLSLWLGAVERLEKSGIEDVGAIHRGFSSYGKKEYRNPPIWEIPIEFRRIRPEIPLICDPSHICGTRENLFDISQQSLNLGFAGLMIESHINPNEAKSDAEQQVTPSRLNEMLQKLKTRRHSDSKVKKDLEQLRSEINSLDDELMDILAKRMGLSKEIGEYKKEHNVTIYQTNRWNEIITKRLPQAEKLGINKTFIESILQKIHSESIAIQTNIINDKNR